MLSIKLKIFKWEIIIRDESLGKLHITEFLCNETEEQENTDINGLLGYKYFNIDPTNTGKRVCALAGNHGMIDYIFRGLGHALLRYQGDAVTLLDGVMQSLNNMRYDIWTTGATTIQLDTFDISVNKNFCLMLSVIKEKADDLKNEIREQDKHLYNIVKKYDIQSYQNDSRYN